MAASSGGEFAPGFCPRTFRFSWPKDRPTVWCGPRSRRPTARASAGTAIGWSLFSWPVSAMLSSRATSPKPQSPGWPGALPASRRRRIAGLKSGLDASWTRSSGSIRIEELSEAIVRSRRLRLVGLASAVIGPALIVGFVLGLVAYSPTRVIVAFALAIGGMVLTGSSRSSTEELERALKQAESRADRGDRRAQSRPGWRKQLAAATEEGWSGRRGIEPSYEAWEASVLPLNYARA